MINKLKKVLKETVSSKRYKHILGVVKSSKFLAKLTNVSEEKAELAALFHDCAKGMNSIQMIEYSKNNNIYFDELELTNKELMHGKIARNIAMIEYNIFDTDILNAIEFHTTGRKNMSKLEMIICLADYIEENRNYTGVDLIRRLVLEDYRKALLKAFDITIEHLIKENKIIHYRTIEARNCLIKQLLLEGE